MIKAKNILTLIALTVGVKKLTLLKDSTIEPNKSKKPIPKLPIAIKLKT